jgi:hypothetical protein
MFHGERQFAALVGDLVAQADDTEVGPRPHRPRFDDGDRAAQGIASQNRLPPLGEVDPRRAFGGGILQDGVKEQAHGDRAGVPARCRKPAEDARLAGLFREVEGLRIEFGREFDDLRGRYLSRCVVEHPAGCEIFEPVSCFGHCDCILLHGRSAGEKMFRRMHASEI